MAGEYITIEREYNPDTLDLTTKEGKMLLGALSILMKTKAIEVLGTPIDGTKSTPNECMYYCDEAYKESQRQRGK